MANGKCLNCGSELADGNFCHICGQPQTVGRLTTKAFAVNACAGLTRINRGFLFTCWKLLTAPWTVISDYIKGRRVRYTSPVQMLLILCFFNVAVLPLIGGGSEIFTEEAEIFNSASTGGFIANAVLKFCMSSPTLQYFILFLPAVPVFMAVNRRKGVAPYNFAEYMVAAIYMSDMVLVFDFVITPFELAMPVVAGSGAYIYMTAMGFIAVYKSLSRLGLPVWRRVLRVVWFLLLTAVIYFAILVAVVLVLYIVAGIPKISAS